MSTNQPADSREGYLFAIGAYSIWGLVLPLYLKALEHVSPFEIVADRILWAVPFAMLILWWQGALGRAVAILTDLRTMALAALTATLISLNWGTYVYAVVSGQAIAGALGYYINPLVNVALAAIFLGERPTPRQGFAIALAAAGVAILTFKAGGLPWISLVLAFSFGTYGLLRKTVKVDASEGFFLEVVVLTIPSVVVLSLLPGPLHFGAGLSETLLLIGAGPLTAVPLIFYAAGARRLHYATIGILQYIVPTLILATAVFVFGEPFGGWQIVAFVFIWTALVLYTLSLLAQARRQRRQRQLAAERVATAHG